MILILVKFVHLKRMDHLPFLIIIFNMIGTRSEGIVTELSAVNSRDPTVEILYKRARNEYQKYNPSGMKSKVQHKLKSCEIGCLLSKLTC